MRSLRFDSEQCILLFNHAAEEMFQCKADEALGRSLDRFLPERFRRTHKNHIASFGETGVATGGNATQAALRAGYSPNTAAEQGYENLRKPQIQEYIKARMMDAKVSTDEIVGTLVTKMRGDVSMLLNDQGEFDLALAKQRKLTHLIKRYKTKTRYIPVKDSEPQKEITVELELYDSQMAAKHLCTVFGLEKLPAANPETVKAPHDRQPLVDSGEGEMISVVAYLLAARKGSVESCNCKLTQPQNSDNHLVLVEEQTLALTAKATKAKPATATKKAVKARTAKQKTLEKRERQSITAEFSPQSCSPKLQA